MSVARDEREQLTIADVTTEVTLIRTSIDETLSVVNVAVTRSTSRTEDVLRISCVEEDESTFAWEICCSNSDGFVATNGSAGNRIVQLVVHDDVVSPSNWQLVPVSGEVILCEVLWRGRIEVEQFLPG